MMWKLEGLAEYDVRRPLTATGTNLLGLIKHLSITEARYFGDVFGRPFPERLPWWDAGDGADMWATADQSRAEIIDRYQHVCEHSDATIAALDIDAPAAAIAELERQSNINEDIIRFLTIRVDEHESGPSAMMRRGEKERERRSDRGDRDDRPSFRAREEEVE